MTATLELPPRPLATHVCLGCMQVDSDPKLHVLYGKDASDPLGLSKWASMHHDCTEQAAAGKWHEGIVSDPTGQGEKHRAIHGKIFNDNLRGKDLRAWIEQYVPLIGAGPTMVTTGLDAVMAEAILNALHPNTATKTIGTVTITAPINIRLMSAVGADDNHAGTEITTGNSYTAAGTGIGAPTWGTATIISNIASLTTTALLTFANMPARTIVAIEEWDSSATKLRGLWGIVTSLTTNAADSVAIAIGGAVDTFQ